MAKSTQQIFDDVVTLVRRLAVDGDLPNLLATTPIDLNTRIDGLGLDSVGKVTLLTAIDEHLGIFIPDDTISDDMTIGALVDQIGRKQVQ